jgi:two-component system response regulator AtoC
MSEEKNTLSVLIIDDDESLRTAIKRNLETEGYHAEEQSSALEGLALLAQKPVDIVLCDMRMPEVDGLEFIERCRLVDPDVTIVLMTGFGSHELALEALKRGAYDYIDKPFSQDELVLILKKIEEREKLKKENQKLKSEVEGQYNFSNIVSQSRSMLSVFDTVKRLAQFNTTVLVTGESGTGKELLAKAIHHNSPRKTQPFVAINCGAIPENLMESELFGHAKGSFTDAVKDKRGLFEEADGGTLFLDEIGELPVHLQVKLLRALQEQEIRRVGDEQTIPINVRVIAATLRDLEKDVQEGRFRDDLYYRLNVVSINIPPLRERSEDVTLLSAHFMKKQSKRLGIHPKEIGTDVQRCLLAYQWPGNVRELENCIERCLVLSDGESVDITTLPTHILAHAGEEVAGNAGFLLDDDNLSIKHHTKTLEVELIRRALTKTEGNRTHAAKILEISHRALLYKLKNYGLSDFEK